MLLFSVGCLLVLAKIGDGEILEGGLKGNSCPSSCTCQLEHLSETAIYRFMQQDKKKASSREVTSSEFNDVLNDDNLESVLFEDKPIVRSAICILQTETEPSELMKKLPKDIETLTLIQGYDTGNKIVKFSVLEPFENLLSLELLGPNSLNRLTNSRLSCEIDIPLPQLKYLNLENILIKNSKTQTQKFVREFTGTNGLTFEYLQKFDTKVHPLTMVQKGTNEEIVPYEKYKDQDDATKVPLFIGFKSLVLLRITKCELNNVHWTMFDGLQNLVYLVLDNNNLRFIPPFAFYGTPNLKILSLAHNNLLDIQITDLAGLLELEFLDLSHNNFSQLSELSLPPFPKLKLANFANNPITVIFPNTFEVMNTTDSLVIGSDDVHVTLMTNSFLGLNLLKSLTLNNLNIRLLKRDMFVGMPNLQELSLTGNITELEYDTFSEVDKLKKLMLSKCRIRNISMDAFMGLENLEYLDLSSNELEYLPPAVFDQLVSLKELYLNNNKLQKLPREIFSKVHFKLIRLNENPWHCSCHMSEWKPMIINRIKQKIIKPCERIAQDKGVGCASMENRFAFKYIFENRVAPKCASPIHYLNWNVFHVMRRLLKCTDYKPKIRKHHHRKPSQQKPTNTSTTRLPEEPRLIKKKLSKLELLHQKLLRHSSNNTKSNNNEEEINELNALNSGNSYNSYNSNDSSKDQQISKQDDAEDNQISNSIL